ncbi:MAG: SDR family oxidoreductase, partial [Candidatus Sericytochromatia bacterium]|nr:SDR family oxidoreductase [Candidatus Sericytochromatia bacterium]
MARRVIVTGGSGGIGRAIASAFVIAGDQVIITGRSPDRLHDAAAALRHGPGTVHPLISDLTEPTAAATMVADGVALLGGFDVIVNNAGIAPISPLLGGPEADEAWEAALATNLTGPWRTIRAALPHLAGGGRIINIGALTGRIGATHYGAFCASKHGLIGLTRSLALDLAPRRITVNAVAPGWVDSALAEQTFEALAAHTGT